MQGCPHRSSSGTSLVARCLSLSLSVFQSVGSTKVDFVEFKSCMLASLRSLLVKVSSCLNADCLCLQALCQWRSAVIGVGGYQVDLVKA